MFISRVYTLPGKNQEQTINTCGMASESKTNIVEVINKYSTIIGILFIAYLQTLFPSKKDFDKLTEKFGEMDHKISEVALIQQTVTQQTTRIHEIEIKIHEIEIDIVKLRSERNLK